ncbi:hypothetical protein HELRODRAFT_181613 [Helobdella robusta]|uniref:UBC core domain-containing protein n=1 Tax=Helobdella robusta TaxID=6412 RepID=T1FH64_HELRO|nr:hypothetical protein HELRODRAFT_181613 [Helobdella robusta]ESN92275.1 hypothetical protein HELRODRAFT_181613 [Helobdella robusta]
MYVIPSAKSSYVWNGVMCLKHGYYKGAIFRFKLVIPETVLDDECPSVLFTPPIYHPLINKQTGVLNINWSFYPWIYEKDRQLFKEKARLAVENCSVKLSATIIDDDEDGDDNNNNNNHNKNNHYDNTDDVNCNLKTHSDHCDADNYDEHSFIFSELSNEELAEAKGSLMCHFYSDITYSYVGFKSTETIYTV